MYLYSYIYFEACQSKFSFVLILQPFHQPVQLMFRNSLRELSGLKKCEYFYEDYISHDTSISFLITTISSYRPMFCILLKFH